MQSSTLGVVAAFCVMASSAWAQQAPITLIHRPQLGPQVGAAPRPAGTGPLDIEAFPRLEGTTPPVVRINAALDRADERALKAARECIASDAKHSDWSRSIDMTMAGPRFVSFVSHDDSFCGGPHPNGSTFALVYDLTTGRPVDWTKLIPARLGGKPGTTEAADGTVLGTLSSPKLKALYIRDMKPDADCKDTLNDTDFNFMFWPDAQAGTVAKHGRGRAKVAIDRRVGWSGRFELEPLIEKLRCLGQGGRAEAEGSLDDAGLPTNVAGDVKG